MEKLEQKAAIVNAFNILCKSDDLIVKLIKWYLNTSFKIEYNIRKVLKK